MISFERGAAAFFWCSVLVGVIAGIFLFVRPEENCFKRSVTGVAAGGLAFSVAVLLCCTAIYVFVPSTKQAALIYGVLQKYVNNPAIQEKAGKAATSTEEMLEALKTLVLNAAEESKNKKGASKADS